MMAPGRRDYVAITVRRLERSFSAAKPGLLCISFSHRFKEVEMPKFITIGYGDQDGYDCTPKPVRDATHAQDEKIRNSGALMGIAGTPFLRAESVFSYESWQLPGRT
jgi:hypothetical protein